MCSLTNFIKYLFTYIPFGYGYRNTDELVEQELEVQIISENPNKCETLRYRY